jgi:hypothetical protein
VDSLTHVVGNIYFYSVPTCGGNFRIANTADVGECQCARHNSTNFLIHAKQDVLKRMSLTEIRKISGYGVDDRGSIHNDGMHDNTGSWTHSTNQKLKSKAAGEKDHRLHLMSRFGCVDGVLRLPSMELTYGNFQWKKKCAATESMTSNEPILHV